MRQGVERAARRSPDYLWLTDADIAHAPDNLRRLVARAEAGKLVLISLMAKLHCESFAERFLIPAFVFFFDMLFPFGWVERSRAQASRRRPAAACWCGARRWSAAGGIEAIRHEIIDDCALGARDEGAGPDLAGPDRARRQLRPYQHMADIRHMVARSAYAQLGYSPLLLAGTVLGHGAGLYRAGRCWPCLRWRLCAGVLGSARLGGDDASLSSRCCVSIGCSPLWGLALPLIGVFYAAFTLDSAVQHWRGRGGMWKGRAQAIART